NILGVSKANPRAVSTISIKIRPGEDMAEAEVQIRALLRQRHKLKLDQEDDFWVRNLSEVLQTQEESSRVMTYLLAAIASVSLFVGGIGIMNIMLVSVTERTRETGLRMAVGARSRTSLAQFPVQAIPFPRRRRPHRPPPARRTRCSPTRSRWSRAGSRPCGS